MSWIDKKYREQLGNQKFPEDMKQQGWEAAQNLLDSHFPVGSTPQAPPATATSGSAFHWIGIAAVLTAIIAVPLFIWTHKDADPKSDLIPESDSIENISEEMRNSLGQTPNIANDKESAFQPEDKVTPNSPQNNSQNVADVPDFSTSNVRTKTTARDTIDDIPEMDMQNVAGNDGLSKTTQPGSKLNSEDKTLLPPPVIVESSIGTEESTEGVESVLFPNVDETDKLLGNSLSKVDEDKNEDLMEVPTIVENIKYDLREEKEKSIDPIKPEEINSEVVDQISDEETTEIIVQNEFYDSLNTDEDQIVNIETPDLPEDDENAKTAVEVKTAHLAFSNLEDFNWPTDLKGLSRERFAVSLWGAYLHTAPIVKATDDEWQKLRREQSKSVNTIPTGAGVDYFLNSHWTVGVGIGISEYAEEVDYRFGNVKSTFDSIFIDGRFDSPSNYNNIVAIDSMRIIDSINMGHWNYDIITRTDDSSGVSYNGRNTFRYIDIPLTLGYRMGRGKLKTWIQTGVILGIPMEMDYYYPQIRELEIVNSSSLAALNNLQYSGLLKLGFDYYLNRSLSLRADLMGSYMINNMFRNSDVEQRYYRYGMSLGLAYTF